MKLQDRIHDLESGVVQCDRNAARRCRTCFEPNTICDGKCWGFWKRSVAAIEPNEEDKPNRAAEPMLPMLTTGSIVEPGPHWNEIRFGSKYEIWDDHNVTANEQPLQTRTTQGQNAR